MWVYQDDTQVKKVKNRPQGRRKRAGKVRPQGADSLDVGRLTATQLGQLFGITPQAVGLWHKRWGCPRSAKGTYDLAAVIAWWKQRYEDRLAAAAEDPLLAGESSDALEAYRKEKTREARRKNAEAERVLLDAAEVARRFQAWAGMLRARFEALERAHGPQVGQALRSAIDRVESEYQAAFPPPK